MKVPLIRLFFNKGIKIINYFSYSDLFKAIKNNDYKYIKEWLNNGGDLRANWYDMGSEFWENILPGEKKHTLLHYAIACGNIEIVKLFVEYGVNVNSAELRCTPLALATAKYRFDIADYLLSQNADINGIGHIGTFDCGFTALMYVCDEQGYYGKINEFPESIYRGGLKNSAIEAVKYLVKKGANINIEDKYGETALCFAIKKCDVKTIKYLVDITDDKILNKFYDDEKLINMACRGFGHSLKENSQKDLEVLKILLNRNIDVNHTHRHSRYSPLSLLEERSGETFAYEYEEELEKAIKMLKDRGAISKV